MGLFKKFNHTKMIVIAEQKFQELYNFGMTIEEKKTNFVGVAASAIFFDEARNSRIPKDEVYKIILGLKDDSPFLKFADNEMNRVTIAKTCEGLYDYFLSEMISESNPVTALYNSMEKYHLEKRYGVVVEGWHDNGLESIVTTYENGIKNGPQVEYYFSGSPKVKRIFVNNILHGRESSWFEDSTIKTLGNYKDGFKDGLWRECIQDEFWEITYNQGNVSPNKKRLRFHYGEQKESEVEFYHNKRNGKCIFWNRFGDKVEEGYYLDDEKHGEWITFFEDGYVQKIIYKNGKLVE
jgi:antitoxin component YwqK of YwqJK toxin-antitoxin module